MANTYTQIYLTSFSLCLSVLALSGLIAKKNYNGAWLFLEQ
jgi:hypothetical protein